MNDLQTPLAGFEQRLLDALRADIAQGRPPAEPASHRRGPRRLVMGAAAAVAVAATAVVVVPTLFSGSGTEARAYTVRQDGDGPITVRIDRYTDAAGLRRTLAEHGITAVVDYVPGLEQCAHGRYRPAQAGVDLAITYVGTSTTFRIVPAQVGRHTLVLELTEPVTTGKGGLSAGPLPPGVGVRESSHSLPWLTDGPVAPCRPQPYTGPTPSR